MLLYTQAWSPVPQEIAIQGFQNVAISASRYTRRFGHLIVACSNKVWLFRALWAVISGATAKNLVRYWYFTRRDTVAFTDRR